MQAIFILLMSLLAFQSHAAEGAGAVGSPKLGDCLSAARGLPLEQGGKVRVRCVTKFSEQLTLETCKTAYRGADHLNTNEIARKCATMLVHNSPSDCVNFASSALYDSNETYGICIAMGADRMTPDDCRAAANGIMSDSDKKDALQICAEAANEKINAQFFKDKTVTPQAAQISQ